MYNTMSSTNTTLNYVGFFTLYVICFVFMYKKMAGVIALGSLTVIHTASTLFIGSEISSRLMNGSSDGIPNNIITALSLISILIAGGMHVVALILIMMMIIELQKKYNATVGTPINLPPEYQNDFNQFKLNAVITFGIICILMYLISFKPRIINEFSIMPITLFASAMSIIGISVYQLTIASKLSDLPNRSIVGR